MAQVTLVPWQAVFPEEFGTPWGIAGVAAAVWRAVSDGNHASCVIIAGMSDSNSLLGKQWRVAGTGAVFSWANKVINSVALSVNINAGAASVPEDTFLAIVSANEPLTYAEQIFNGGIRLTPGVPTWIALSVNQASAINAILADNYLLSVINYNHGVEGHSVTAEAAQLVVTYTDNIPRASLAMEA